jgi:hypothetical protein
VEKTHQKREDVAKRLGQPPSTLNTIIEKKKIREHAYVSVAQELATCGVVCCVWKKREVSWEVEVAWRRCKVVVVMTKKPSLNQCRVLQKHFMRFESMKELMYVHDITDRDQANIVNIESLLFKLKGKGDTKQMKINDFLKKV